MTSQVVNALEAAGETDCSNLERLARGLHVKEAGLAATLEVIVGSAVETIEVAAYAGVNLLIRGRFTPQATVGEPPPVLDRFQQETSEGPCIDASRYQLTLCVDDMAQERRWPAYAELALTLGVRSMLCVPLWVDDLKVGSLSLYATSPGAFGPWHEGVATLLATHAAIALADAQRTEHLRTAIANRDVIGMAKGILIERHRLTPDEAFALLAESSQKHNRQLLLIAQDLLDTGELP